MLGAPGPRSRCGTNVCSVDVDWLCLSAGSRLPRLQARDEPSMIVRSHG